MEVGFIGLGKMGKPMAERLLAAKHSVHVFNRSKEVLRELSASGALIAKSAAAAASESEVILTALPTPDSVEIVYSELAQTARSGQIYADHSTVPISLNQLCATWLRNQGAAFLDAPVSGGPAGAEAGALTVMVGGDEIAFKRISPVLECFGKNVRLCGPVGAGQAVKLVNQLLVAVHTAAIAEAAVLGKKLGAEPEIVLDLVGSAFGGSAMLRRNLPRFISRDFAGVTPVRLILKDLGIIHDEARRQSVPILFGALAEQRFLEAEARGWASEDMAAVVKLWEEATSTTVATGKAG